MKSKRKELAVLLLSLVLGVAGTFIPGTDTGSALPLRTDLKAWWGGLYPQYCLPGAAELVYEDAGGPGETGAAGTDREGLQEEIPVRIRFRYLTFLNELGGTDE